MLSLVAYLLYASCLFTLAFDAVSGSRLDKYSVSVRAYHAPICHYVYVGLLPCYKTKNTVVSIYRRPSGFPVGFHLWGGVEGLWGGGVERLWGGE